MIERKFFCLLWAALLMLVVSCQPYPMPTERFIPTYLRLRLCGGAARVQLGDSSEWVEMRGEVSIDDAGRIMADASEGAQICTGDGSRLDMTPEATIAVQNPQTFPRLEVTLEKGGLQFEAQKPSYEFILPGCTLTLREIPTSLHVELVDDGRMYMQVEEGAIDCLWDGEEGQEAETLTLTMCQEVYIKGGEKPEVGQFCKPRTPTPTPLLADPSPSPTRWSTQPTRTATVTETTAMASPTPTNMPTSTPGSALPTWTPTPLPTNTPPPPPPTSKPKPKPTEPPPTNPPPTNPPPTNPPPTQPPPTESPPTNTPRPRPTPTSAPAPTSEPTSAPAPTSEPTSAPRPTATP